MIDKEQAARDKFHQRIQKGMLGPGSDTWGLPDEEEIISDYPLQRYFTGILFPPKSLKDNGKFCTQSEIDSKEVENETSGEEDAADERQNETDGTGTESEEKRRDDIREIEENRISQNYFFPTNMGLTVCVDNSARELDVEFSFGLYYEPPQKEIKIRIDEKGYRSFFDENIPHPLPFKDILKYRDGYMLLERPLQGKQGGKRDRSDEFKQFDEFKEKQNLKKSLASGYISELEKLVSGRVWRREPHPYRIKVPVTDTPEPVLLQLGGTPHNELKVGYHVKTFPFDKATYVKIQLVNLSTPHPANRFSNKFEKLNRKCLFQSKIRILSEQILPYKTHGERSPFDEEAKRLDFIYRRIKSYGIGHNCAVAWTDDHKTLETTFVPYQDIRDVENKFDRDASDSVLEKALDIKNLSDFGLTKAEVIQSLNHFIARYGQWIEDQKAENNKNSPEEKTIGSEIIQEQEDNFERIQANIALLQENERVFQAFRLANTAMFIQMIISNDRDFGGSEKNLAEVNNNIAYNDLAFFRTYPFGQKDRIKNRPQYRPFQLAFFLLSLDGIVLPESRSRKEIVDLIWFPTGGGKTEAYLAVAAFSIIWRRFNHETVYQGTSVIMRYTLRLLTSQQFERASRMIVALEFLRRQKEFKTILRSEPISIGLWVGMGATPNKLEDVKALLEKIEGECNRGDRGAPEEKNVFQISACSWCGTKVISKNEQNRWDYSFETGRKNFKIGCLNSKCVFHEELPIQVIDEILYKKPPTLLFATVDKFAMLSWQPDASSYFNSLDDEKLPPDLIIQDELHLLSGPLGSITGLFESVVEYLCTKKGIGPKIIASTATTRNTKHQIEGLYGNRKVNIFPPSGLHYDDSFFARESKGESKRRYVGFMPTGKTAIDTQLHLLAHLFTARLEVYADQSTKEKTGDYWTIVSYYNSLKDVGKIFNKVGDEVANFTSTLQHRLSRYFQPFDDYRFNFYGILGRTEELTSRIESAKIKAILKKLEKSFTADKLKKGQNGQTFLSDVVDLVVATNMISVGIDVGRLNIILLNGMPKNVAEYIQASSRIGRQSKGLAVALLDPNRAREKSYFEHFKPFHQAFYKGVEPLSVTPFTENTIKKMLASMLITFVRHSVPGMAAENQAQYFKQEMIEPLKVFIRNRFNRSQKQIHFFEKEIDRIAHDWVDQIDQTGLKKYSELLKKPAERQDGKDEDWTVMQSMREIDTNTFIQIKESF